MGQEKGNIDIIDILQVLRGQMEVGEGILEGMCWKDSKWWSESVMLEIEDM